MTTTAVDRLLDDASLTPSHWRVWLLSAMGIMLDGFDFFIIGVATPLIAADLGATPAQIGLISSAAVMGAIVGAFGLGRLTDRIGRRLAFRLDLGMFVVFALLSGVAWSVWALIAFRFLLGIGIGADYPISASYVAEIAPARHRARLLVGAFSFQAVGQVLGALVGLGILLTTDAVGSWRWMLAAGAIPALIIVYLRRGVPESPKWLAGQGRVEEATTVMGVFVGHPVDGEVVAASAEVEAAEEETHATGYRALLTDGMWRLTVLTMVPWFLMDIATYGVGVFTPTILAALAFSGDGTFLADDIASTEGAVAIDLLLVVGFGLAILLINRVRHTNLQLLGFVVMAVGLCTLAVATGLTGGGDEHLALVFVGFGLFNIFMNLGPNATTFLLPAEVFPTRVRASGHGLAAGAGKAGAAMGTLLFPIIRADVGLAPLLVAIAVGCVVAAGVTAVFRVGVTAAGGPVPGRAGP